MTTQISEHPAPKGYQHYVGVYGHEIVKIDSAKFVRAVERFCREWGMTQATLSMRAGQHPNTLPNKLARSRVHGAGMERATAAALAEAMYGDAGRMSEFVIEE